MPYKKQLKEVQDELNRKADRLKIALEATGLGIWDFNPKTKELVWDEKCKALFGLPPDAPISYDTFQQRLVPEFRGKVDKLVKKAFNYESGGYYQTQYQMIRANDNQKRWVKSTGKVSFNEDKEAVRLVGTVQDITDIVHSREKLEQTQLALQRKTEVLQTINDIGKIISAELNHKKVVQLITDAGTEITRAEFGAYFYNETDDQGERYLLFTHSGLGKDKFNNYPMPRNTKIFGPTFKGERIVRYEDVTKQKEFGQNPPYFGMPKGHPPVKSYLAVPVFAKSGDVLGGLFFGHSKAGVFTQELEEIIAGIASQAAIAIENAELYEQARKANEAVREQSQLMYRIFEDAPAAIIITKGKDHVYEFINKKGREIFGNYFRIGANSNSVRNIPRYRKYFEILDNVYNTGESAIIPEIPIDLKDFNQQKKSDLRYFNSFYFPVKNNNGEIEGIIRYGLEITEQVKARKSIEDFISIASHELKTPITTVMSYLELLQDNFYADKPEEKQIFIDKLDKGIKRLNNLVSDLLDVTRISKGRLEFNFEDFAAEPFVKEALNNIIPIAGDRKIIFTGGTNNFINGDPRRLEQVITNLTINALKYSKDKIEVILDADERNIYLSIRDYGVGMDGKELKKLFSQFYVIDEKKSTGLGIGLYISKEIVKGHNGDILVKSKIGKGSVFTVILPALSGQGPK